MKLYKIDSAIPIAGAAIGGLIVGIIARNGFVGWTGEALAAGFLGLGGGMFALLAARAQIEAQRKQRLEDITREEKLLNSQCYSACVEVGDLIFAWVTTTKGVFDSKDKIDGEMFLILHETLSSIEIPTSPMTVAENISSTLIGIRVLKSRVTQTLIAMERFSRSQNELGHKEQEEIEIDSSLYKLVDLIHDYGNFLKEEALNQLELIQ